MAIVTRPEQEVAAPTSPEVPSGNGSGGAGRISSAGAWRRRWHRVRRAQPLLWIVVAAVVVAGTLVGVEATSGAATYGLRAVFSSAPGLFAGASVEVLGVPVGTVTSVRTVGDTVVVGMRVDSAQPVPAGATASLVAPQLLGEPDIELAPGYTGGPTLAGGTTIPESRTSVPVSTEQLLKSLQETASSTGQCNDGRIVAILGALPAV